MIKGIKAILELKLGLNRESDLKTIVIQFMKFGMVGISNTLISWLIYYVFVWLNSGMYICGSIVGGVVSIANAFFWNDKFVFKGKENDVFSKFKRLCKTYVSYGGTSLLGLLLLWIEVELFNLNKLLAPPLNLILTIPLNFFINKFWTFKDKENR